MGAGETGGGEVLRKRKALPVSHTPSCSVFLLDRVSHELVAKVFDGGVVNDDEVEQACPLPARSLPTPCPLPARENP